MNLKLRHTDLLPREAATPTPKATTSAHGSASPVSTGEAPSIGAWLAVLATMLPRKQAASIREELEMHLRERVRDLMVGGSSESEATRRAIAELGEAADMAARYRALRTEPQRRLIMYGTVFAVCGAALALSIAAVTGAKVQPETVARRGQVPVLSDVPIVSREFKDPGAGSVPILRDVPIIGSPGVPVASESFKGQPTSPELKDLKVDVDFAKTPASEVLEAVGKFAGMPVQVDWAQLTEAGLNPQMPVTLRARGASAAVILRALNEATGAVGALPIDWRVSNGVIEVARSEHFDKREVALVIYELEGVIAARQQKYNEERVKVVEEVVLLIKEFVYPEGWRDNGGDLAKLTVVGDRMFVEAPERFHTQIRWMMEQLPSQKAEAHGMLPGRDVRKVPLRAMAAVEALALIGQAMNIAPGLGRLDGSRTFTVSARDNAILMQATDDQCRAVEEVLRLIDLPEGDVRGGPESRRFTLGHVSPRALRDWLGRVFNASPGLKQCAVPRVMECDESDGRFELTATPDQVETVARLIALVDRPSK